MTVMAAHQPTKALASFAADLDPAALPPEVRQKLGWLLLDYLRVCSIGARLPWSDWARKHIGLSLQPGHFRRGFQSTGTCDVFGTAAAAARLIFRGRDASRENPRSHRT